MSENPSLHDHARTKIVATVGPASRSRAMLIKLVHAGVNVFRVNMAHGSHEEHTEVVNTIREVSEELRRPIAILADLAGPKIRLGELPGGMIECTAGEEFRFVRGTAEEGQVCQPGELLTTYAPLIDELAVGDRVMLADAAVGLIVQEKTADYAKCAVVQPGVIRSRQGVNLPGVKLSVPAMDAEDRRSAQWAAQHEIDYLSLSFVRHPKDVLELKQMLYDWGSYAKVVAKIEKPEALTHLVEIVKAADAVMVARGDLGVEIDVAEMPLAQKRIIKICNEYQKPVIIATQMLDSMQHSRLPTRAEVTDVANAILDGADACMLSGETAIGNYPVETVSMMRRIAKATEEQFRELPPPPEPPLPPTGVRKITQAIVYGAGKVMRSIDVKLVFVVSRRGGTALALSKRRILTPTVGMSESERVLRQMCLYWGVHPIKGAPTRDRKKLLEFIDHWGVGTGYVQPDDLVVIITGTGDGQEAHNGLEVHRV